jgi:hypothetical protein
MYKGPSGLNILCLNYVIVLNTRMEVICLRSILHFWGPFYHKALSCSSVILYVSPALP